MVTGTALFADRAEAGRLLAEPIVARHFRDAIVYALPRGGTPVAFEIAKRLDAPLELALVRKIGAPGNPELALAAVADGGLDSVVVNEDILRLTGASEAYLRQEATRELAEIERRRRVYLGERPRPDPRGRTVIIVDDGLATGATARVAVKALRHQGAARIVLAVPVAPPDTASLLRGEVDDLVCLSEPESFRGVGAFYRDFHQLTDSEVIDLLRRAATFGGVPPPA